MRVLWSALVFVVTAAASDAFAQADNRPTEFRGRVVDSVTRLPVAGAIIEISEKGIRQITDSSGRFIVGAPPGQYSLHARRLGYAEAIETIRIHEGDGSERTLALRPVTLMLKEVVISGRTVTFSPFFEAAYKRATGARGFFFTREDIAESNARDYQTLLNRIPGVSANDRGVTFRRCQAGFEVLNNPKARAKVQIWIDGFHMPASTDPTGVYDVLRTVKPQSVEIMEVYPSQSVIPAEFSYDACAAIVIWTKRD